jgi:hypothetical protein
MSKICFEKIATKYDITKKGGVNIKKVAYKYIKQAYLRCAIGTTKCCWPQSYKTNYQREQVGSFNWLKHKYDCW